TWSRQRLNSSTSSGGKKPWPDDTIWPSLMYAGPSRSKARRSRRDRPARDVAPPARRSWSCQAASADPRNAAASVNRPSGGRRRRRTSSGTSAWALARRASMPARHTRSSGSMVHGPRSLKAPHATPRETYRPRRRTANVGGSKRAGSGWLLAASRASRDVMDDGKDTELARLRAENDRLKRAQSRGVTLKVSEKGGVSVYGLGRFPV